MFARHPLQNVEVILYDLEAWHFVEGLDVVAGNHTYFVMLNYLIEHFVTLSVVQFHVALSVWNIVFSSDILRELFMQIIREI